MDLMDNTTNEQVQRGGYRPKLRPRVLYYTILALLRRFKRVYVAEPYNWEDYPEYMRPVNGEWC